jgi:hypothetical protein
VIVVTHRSPLLAYVDSIIVLAVLAHGRGAAAA